ncbi:MAG: low molecular weight phosphatase family protein [Rhizobiaceae bacterium]|nr:low molecular weight phosphatase family protein [Rhizobiaceae bacterium]
MRIALEGVGLAEQTKNRPTSVLFVCAMNAIRSPMAEYLTRDLFGKEIYVQSAGIRAGEPSGFTLAAMQDRGISIISHKPTKLDDLADQYFDLIVTLSPEAHHSALELTRTQAVDVEYWPTEDPSTIAGNREQVLQGYIKVRDFLEAKIKERFSS